MNLVQARLREVAELPQEEIREEIFKLQTALCGSSDQTDLSYFPVRHVFAPGCYAREMTIPEGQVIIGKIHKHEHVNVISMGRVQVLSEFGMEYREAPCTFVSQPGIKRVVYALETTVWTTIHITDETDLDKIEAEIIAPDYKSLGIIQAEFRREQ
jgi:hypothetical protein